MAEKFVKALYRERMQKIVTSWHHYAHRTRERAKHFAEKEAAAEQMAMKFRKNHDREAMGEMMGIWRKFSKDQKHENELEKLRSSHRAKGDAVAEQMAKKFLQNHNRERQHKIIVHWRNYTSRR